MTVMKLRQAAKVARDNNDLAVLSALLVFNTQTRMLQITQWQPNQETKLICGHTVSQDATAYKLTLNVCQQDIACLPQAITASLQVQQTLAVQSKPSFLYRLWHWCFGKKPKKPLPPAGSQEPSITNSLERRTSMPQVKKYTAKQDLQLDCGHTIKKGEILVVTSVYTCAHEQSWPLTILLGCLHVLQQKQATKPPVQKTPIATTQNVYTNRRNANNQK